MVSYLLTTYGGAMEVVKELFTVKDLATACKCSKQTIDKHITNKGLVSTFTNKMGKQVRAYELTNTQLEELKNLVAVNKGLVTPTNNPINNDKTISDEWLEKYIEMKALYSSEVATRKLLEDRQGSQLQEIKELNATINSNNQIIGGLEKTIANNAKEITEVREKAEAEKTQLTKALKLRTNIIIALSSALVVILLTVICRVLLTF